MIALLRCLRGAAFLIIVLSAGLTGTGAQSAAMILYTVRTDDGVNRVQYQRTDADEAIVTAASGSLLWAGNWSHDAASIALNRQHDGIGAVFALNPSTAEEYPLTGGGAHYYAPVWSPVSPVLAIPEQSLGRSRIVLLDVATGTQSVLYDGLARFNTWSPDGRYAIITVDTQPLIVEIATRNAARLNVAGFEDTAIDVTDWNGSHIAFTHIDRGAESIYIASIDGSAARRAVPDDANHRWLRWSSDGASFVFLSERDSANGDVYLADADGANVRRVTNIGDDAEILTLDYWTPPSGRAAPSALPDSLALESLADLLDASVSVDPADPVSVAFKALDLMLSGALSTEPNIVCADYRDTYTALSDSIRADFEAPDLSGVALTLIEQHTGWARIRLSGVMTLRTAGTRTIFPASLIPVQNNPVTDLLLVDDAGWRICTPL